MSVTRAGSARTLDIGKVLQDTINVLARNIMPFGLMAVLLVGIPSIIAGYGQYAGSRNFTASLLAIVGALASLVATPILQGGLIYGAMRDMSGDRASFKECLTVGRKRWGSMLGFLILGGLGVGFGSILLIVPGVLLALRWSVSGPVLIMERGRSIGDAMGRSVDLTKGRRGSIFLLLLVYAVLFMIYEAVVLVAAGGVTAIASKPVLVIVVTPLVNIASNLLLSVGVAALYRQLRGDRDSASPDALAEVFA